MCEQEPSTRLMEQGNRIFVCFGVVEAAVDLALNLSILEQQTFRTQSFADHRKAAILRCRCCIKTVAVADPCVPVCAVKAERTAAAHPIDQVFAAPAKRMNAGCREAVLPEQSHRAS